MIARALIAVFGIIEFLFPERVADTAMEFAATEESEYELRSWVYAVARVEGLAIVALALWCGRHTSCADDE